MSMSEKGLHFDRAGNPRMVDVGGKTVTARTASARGEIILGPPAVKALEAPAKGPVEATAAIAGIQAAKKASELIPLCHPLPMDKVDILFRLDGNCLTCTCSVRGEARTGYEMEALTGVSVALLTVYDMLKAVDREMVIRDVRLVSKTGGKSGDWRRNE
jgi:cyclic pyranopterin phosphate synthase